MNNLDYKKIVNWESLIEKRDGYYIEYIPCNEPFCHLMITFVTEKPSISVLEKELNNILIRFPVNVMVTTWDAADNPIYVRENYNLYGIKNKIIWLPLNEYHNFDKIPLNEFISIHSQFKFKTRKDCEIKANAYIRTLKTARILSLIINILNLLKWFLFKIIPILKLMKFIWELQSHLDKIILCLKLRKKHPIEVEQEKNAARNKHILYHANLNPNGFQKLVKENLEKEIIEKNLTKVSD